MMQTVYDDDHYDEMCECELDWNCSLHANQMFTAIERINDRHAAWQTEDEGPF